MTTLQDRGGAALLVIDVQTGVMKSAHARDAVIANIAGLVERARLEGVPVLWVQHISDHLPKGSEAGRIVPELAPDPAEPLIEKRYGDAFEETMLESVLARLGVGRLIVAGAQTDACIRSTLHGGLTRGYDMILVSDAHSTDDASAWGCPPPEQVIAHTNFYWTYQTAPGRVAGTAKAEAVRLQGVA